MRAGEMSVTATSATPGGTVPKRRLTEVKFDPELRTALLCYFLRLVSLGYLAAFIPWITLILLDAPILAPGSSFAPMLRFQPYNPDYESMLAAINLVWAVMLWRSSGDPARHALFLDFTIWASAAHGLVMIIATPLQKGLPMTFIEGLPLFFVAAVLWWLRPGNSPVLRRPAPVAVEPCTAPSARPPRHARSLREPASTREHLPAPGQWSIVGEGSPGRRSKYLVLSAA